MDAPSGMDRRGFLARTGVLTGVLLSLGPAATLVSPRAWAVEFHALTTEEAEILLAATRTIAPHDGLDTAAYALVVKGVDAEAVTDASWLQTVRSACQTLGKSFAGAPEAARVAALKSLESSEFFARLRIKILMVLYSNPIAYAHFGYEGEVYSRGGYLLHGFDDLTWLPDVPLADSGPMPIAR